MTTLVKNLVSSPQPSGSLATVGVIAIGEMGLGFAKLLLHHKYRVLTNIEGRSENTQKRAASAKVELVKTDIDLANQSDYILSIVPPRDAVSTAQRIVTAISSSSFVSRSPATPLHYLDLNAISPARAREIAALFAPHTSKLRFIDGGIIGGAPSPSDQLDPSSKWKVPSTPLSGPHRLDEAEPSGADLAKLMNTKHIGPEIGTASGLKMCFASLTKGFTALAIQSFTTASALGVLPELKATLESVSPATGKMTNSLTKMPPKAYRWVKEMKEIEETFAVDGGFSKEESIFGGIAAVYDLVAHGTVLGGEITEKRKRGTSVDDVAECVTEGIKKRKTEK